jgi:hypothetical protein
MYVIRVPKFPTPPSPHCHHPDRLHPIPPPPSGPHYRLTDHLHRHCHHHHRHCRTREPRHPLGHHRRWVHAARPSPPHPGTVSSARPSPPSGPRHPVVPTAPRNRDVCPAVTTAGTTPPSHPCRSQEPRRSPDRHRRRVHAARPSPPPGPRLPDRLHL